MQPRQAIDQRQAQPRAAGLAVEAVVDLRKRLQHPRQLVFRNAGPIIFDDDLQPAAGKAGAGDGDMPAFGRELHRIGKKIQQHLAKGAFVGQHQGRIGGEFDRPAIAVSESRAAPSGG